MSIKSEKEEQVIFNNYYDIYLDKKSSSEFIFLPSGKRFESSTCPAGINLQRVIEFLSKDKIDEALEEVRKYNPFPITCGILCSYPCEKNIPNYFILKKGIDNIKKFLINYEISNNFFPKQYNVIHKEKIAVIGIDYNSLILGIDLCRFGFDVHILTYSNKLLNDLKGLISPNYHHFIEKELIFIQESGIKIFELEKNIDKINNYDILIIEEKYKEKIKEANKKAYWIKKEKITLAEEIGETHKLALKIYQDIKNIKLFPKLSGLPIIRKNNTPCDFRITIDWKDNNKDNISQISRGVKCLSCGLWKKNILENFEGEGCINCALCEKCEAYCNYSQILLKDEENNKILVKTPKDLSIEIHNNHNPLELKSINDNKEIRLYSLIPKVNEEKCIGCGVCEENCPYNSIRVKFNKKRNTPIASISVEACRGCSICISACPTQSLSNELLDLNNLNTPESDNFIFTCAWNGTFQNFKQDNSNYIKLLCTQYITPRILFISLLKGAKKVEILSCDTYANNGNKDNCHYIRRKNINKIIDECNEILDKIIGERAFFLKNTNKISKGININLKKDNVEWNLGTAILSLKYLETYFNKNNNELSLKEGIILGIIPYLEDFLKIENLIDKKRGSITKSIYSILEKLELDFPIINKISGLEFPTKEEDKELWNQAIENLKKLKLDKIIVPFPELYNELYNIPTIKPKLSTLVKEIKNKNIKFYNQRKYKIGLHVPCYINHYNFLINENIDLFNKSSLKLAEYPKLPIGIENFYNETIELLNSIPNLEIIPILDSCGHNFWKNFHNSQREILNNFIKKAKDNKIDIIVSISPYCSTHLDFLFRKGGWREYYINFIDLYTFIKSFINEEDLDISELIGE